jgi:biopolymer transport protein TolR
MRNYRKKRKQISEINIVPYVDVMLVLLVIFMITTPIITQGVQVDLPKAAAKPMPSEDKPPIVVAVDKRGNLFLSIAATPTHPLAPQLLQAEVIAALQKEPQRKVLIRGDRTVDYDTILSAMVLLQQAGVPSIGLETRDTN